MIFYQSHKHGNIVISMASINDIHGIGTMKENRKHMQSLIPNEQTKPGVHDWQASKTLSPTKWLTNPSFCFLTTKTLKL